MTKNLWIIILAIAVGGVGAVLSKGTLEKPGPTPSSGKIIAGTFDTSEFRTNAQSLYSIDPAPRSTILLHFLTNVRADSRILLFSRALSASFEEHPSTD